MLTIIYRCLECFDTSDRLEVNFRSIGKIVSILNNIYNDSSFEQQPTESNANVVPDIEPHVIISSNVPESIYTLQKKLSHSEKLQKNV